MILSQHVNTASGNSHKFVLNKNNKRTFNWVVQDFELPGIGITRARYTQSPKIENTEFAGTAVTYDDLQVTFLLDENLESYIEIYTWMMDLMAPDRHQSTSLANEESTASVHIMTNQLAHMGLVFNFHRLWPTNLGGIQFVTTNDGEPAVLTCTVTFKYTKFDIELDANRVI